MDNNLIYQMAAVEEDHFWYWGKRNLLLNTTKKLPFVNNALDIGCGTGILLKELSKVIECRGVDPSPAAQHLCQERGLDVIQAEATNLPFDNDKFDLVIMSDLLEHVENDLKALEEAYRVLRPGGYLLVTVPAYPRLYGPHDRTLKHFRRYSKYNLLNVVQANNFWIKEITFTNVLLVFPALLLSLFKSFSKEKPRTGMLPWFLNRIMKGWYKLENHYLSRFNLPFGLSLFCIAQK